MAEKTVIITQPDDPDVTFVYTPDRRSGFYFTTTIPGGDDTLGLMVPCEDLDTIGYPKKGATVRVYLQGVTNPIWIGRLEEPEFEIEDRTLKSVSLVAKGFQYSGQDQKFSTALVFGPASLTSSGILTDKIVTADLKGAIEYALTQKCPDITSGTINLAGFNLHADTQPFSGQTAVDVWNFISALTAFMSDPFVWEVYADPITGLPTFYWMAAENGATYYDNGKSKQHLKYPLSSIINVAIVEWGNRQRWTEPLDSGSAINYTPLGGAQIRRDKYVTMQTEYQGLDDIKALAQGYLARFNVDRASGEIVLEETPRGGGVVDIAQVRAGKIIECELPDGFPGEGTAAGEQHYIVGTRWEEGSEDVCDSISLTIGEISGIYSEIRRLQTIPNANVLWAIDFATYGKTIPEVQKALQLGSEWPATPVSATDPQVRTVIPMAAISDGTNTYGPLGGQLIPEIIPTRYMGPMMVFKSGNSSPVPTGNNVARGNCLDWKELNSFQIISKESSNIVVRVNKNGILEATCTLPSGLDSGVDPIPEGAFSTVIGDIITYDIVTNTASTDFSIMIYGEADHPTFPSYPAPTP